MKIGDDMKLVRKVSDHRQEGSLANKLRKKRFALFSSLISTLPRPLKILDVGGTEQFWESMGFHDEGDIEIIILNLEKNPVSRPNFVSAVGDARNLEQFKDNEFDIAFSNSVIEHINTFDGQMLAAKEIMRVGIRYFVQTPNRYFPIEPHFLFPFFQLLPVRLRFLLIRNFKIGWYSGWTDNKPPESQRAWEIAREIRLLSKRELTRLFPGAKLFRERFLGLNKSFIVYNGWEKTGPSQT
jgi:hypothetical protein